MSPNQKLLENLRDTQMSLVKTIDTVEQLELEYSQEGRVNCGVSSNISVDLLSVYLRKHALINGASLNVEMGGYNIVVTDATKFAASSSDVMVYIPFFDNLMPSFETRIPLMSQSNLEEKLRDFRSQCELFLKTVTHIPRVFVTKFHRFGQSSDPTGSDQVDETLSHFNQVLDELAGGFSNAKLIDTESIVNQLGALKSYDRRFYQVNLAPYTPAFLDELAHRISIASRGFGSYFYKALVLDCDNTLWGGIVGEVELNGIKLDEHTYPGRVYWQAQLFFKSLESKGVLICLCSKNEFADIDEVLETHPYCVLRQGDISVKKVNWADKAENLKEIARELNISLDSLVFLDDSDFECAAVRAQVPEVKVLQVPAKLSDYGFVLRELEELFVAGGISSDSSSKTDHYRHAKMSSDLRNEFLSHEEYLWSLNVVVEIRMDDPNAIDRISELTQKSNQFNLTTIRMSVGEVQARINDPLVTVFSINVKDRFGNSGLTGVVIVNWVSEIAVIEELLLSCRVLGRGIEFALWQPVLSAALKRGCTTIQSKYSATARNSQVEDYYERVGMSSMSSNGLDKYYQGDITKIDPPETGWIEVEIYE